MEKIAKDLVSEKFSKHFINGNISTGKNRLIFEVANRFVSNFLAKEKELLQEIIEKYNKQTSVYYAAARLWVDEIIDPAETRNRIALAIQAANHAPIEREWKSGVFQV